MNYEQYYELAGSKQHSEFEAYLKRIIFEPKERRNFYDGMRRISPLMKVDSFKPYFELYAAERKSNMQDYTPDSVAKLLAVITRAGGITENTKYAGWDPTAGTGSLLIQKWNDDRIQESLFSYAPHRYLYRADELADNVIPYLIHNLAMRGMNAIIVHGNALEGIAKQVYFLQNSNDDYGEYSQVNVMPHSADCMREFGIKEWIEKPIEYIETQHLRLKYAQPMKRKKLEVNTNPKIAARPMMKDQLLLKHVAEIERAKKGKVYPAGTIVIQLSATKGQVGLLKSSGEIGAQYAAVEMNYLIDSAFAFYQLKHRIPKHFRRVQEGLNVPIEEIGTCPFWFPIEFLEIVSKPAEYEQLALEL